MALGIVSDKDFESELNNSSRDRQQTELDTEPRTSNNPIITSDVLDIKPVGREPDVTNVPQSLRKILGETVVTEGLNSARQLANQLNGRLSQPTLSTYATGQVSRNIDSPESKDLTEYINGRKTKITKRAMNKLNLALSHLDDSKLLGLEARELSGVAKDMAVIVKQMEPTTKESDDKKDPVQFHFYAPQIRNEAHYEVVQAKDNY